MFEWEIVIWFHVIVLRFSRSAYSTFMPSFPFFPMIPFCPIQFFFPAQLASLLFSFLHWIQISSGGHGLRTWGQTTFLWQRGSRLLFYWWGFLWSFSASNLKQQWGNKLKTWASCIFMSANTTMQATFTVV